MCTRKGTEGSNPSLSAEVQKFDDGTRVETPADKLVTRAWAGSRVVIVIVGATIAISCRGLATDARAPAPGRACLDSCGGPPAGVSGCAAKPAVKQYLGKLIQPIHEALEPLEQPESVCVCYRVWINANGSLSDVVVTRGSSERDARRITKAVQMARPGPRVPPEAACILERPFNPLGLAYVEEP
jgi:hypothetical protein